jgi:hypothetical protein
MKKYEQMKEMYGNTTSEQYEQIDIFPLIEWAVFHASYAFESDRMNPQTFRKWFSENLVDIQSETYIRFIEQLEKNKRMKDGTAFADSSIIPCMVYSARIAMYRMWYADFLKQHNGNYVDICPLSESIHDAWTANEIDQIEMQCGLHHAIESVKSDKIRENLLSIEKWIAEGLTSYEIAWIVGIDYQKVQYYLKQIARKWIADC